MISNQPLSKKTAFRTTREFMDVLGVPDRLKSGVLDAYGKMFPRPEDGIVEFESQVCATIACLLMVLEIERDDAAEHAEYMRLRGIAQGLFGEWLEPKGYASQFEGEPEFYGIVNALVIKLLKVYGEKAKCTIPCPDCGGGE